jgi:hypothetical protein
MLVDVRDRSHSRHTAFIEMASTFANRLLLYQYVSC